MRLAQALPVAALAVLALAAGCGKAEPEAAPVVSARTLEAPKETPTPDPAPAESGQHKSALAEGAGQVVSAPGDYAYGVTVTSRRWAGEKAALTRLTQDIRLFEAEKGRLPESLKELADWRGAPLPELPADYQWKYDAKTGKVSVVKP
jgi:hypothetical protein